MVTEQQNANVEDDKDVDLDTGEIPIADQAGADGSQGKSKTILWLIIGLVVVVVVSLLLYLFVFSSSTPAEDVKDAPPKVADVKKSPELTKASKALYAIFDNDFIATLVDKDGKDHHMVIAVTMMVRDPQALEAINKNKPLLSNNLLELFESQNYEAMKDIKGKQQLREKSLAVVNRAIKDKTQDKQVDAILFTKFMMD